MSAIGKISGLCADYSQATYNGRPYDKIYQRILDGKDFRFNEMMKRGGIPCELGHPTDLDSNGNPRTETDPTKIAVIITDISKGGPQQLVASGTITDTPNGRIFKELSQYYKFGLSSRGSYEVNDDFDIEGPYGWNQDSYVFKGYDLVLLPANNGSVLSVTEGIGDKKTVKVAREEIDVNLLAEASEVSEDQVEEALDQLFGISKDAEKSEEVSISDFNENQSEDSEELKPERTEETEKDDENKVETTLITDGEEVDKIKADLQTALDQIKTLLGGKEKDGIEIANRDAEVARLTSENEDLKLELDERIKESEDFVEKFEKLKDTALKLVESYKQAKKIFEDSKKSDEDLAKIREDNNVLKEQLDEEKSKRLRAEESLDRLKNRNSLVTKELLSAKESLISYHSRALGISEKALRNTLGKSYSVKNIRAVAESIANESTYSIPVLPVARRASSTESLMVGNDDIEREIIAQINQDN